MSLSEVEETLTRIQSHRGVVGVLILTSSGTAIRSSLPPAETDQYAALISQLATKASSVARTLDPSDDLTFLRIRSRNHEIMVAPDKEYLLIVIQNPNVE
jgi:dynein light chain roadblock-type